MHSVATPRFIDLYVEQLLSPLAVFQIFCSVLWLLDAVSIGFTVFQVAMILMLESTSVFQRQRTLKTLNQMSAKPYNLFVYRHGQWTERSTTELLPGGAGGGSGTVQVEPKRTSVRAMMASGMARQPLGSTAARLLPEGSE